MTTVLVVKCRCGATHQARERAVPCSICHTDTWDFHGICARCRGTEESLAREVGGRIRPGKSGRVTNYVQGQASTP